MKIFVVCSKVFYDQVAQIKQELEAAGHEVTLPMSYDNPRAEIEAKAKGPAEHAEKKSSLLRQTVAEVDKNDALVVLNFEKEGVPNYIGGATFIEVFKAWELGKKIYFYNPLPEGLLHDELLAMGIIVLNGDLEKVND